MVYFVGLIDRVSRSPVLVQGFPTSVLATTENIDQAAMRVLQETAILEPAYLEQLYTFSDVNCHARNQVVSVTYFGCVRSDAVSTYEHPTLAFVPVCGSKKLAYGHNEVLLVASQRLAAKVSYTTVAQFQLPRYFTLTALQQVYETATKLEFDKRNFRKKIMALDIIKDTGYREEGVHNRPATLYQFKRQKIEPVASLV